MGSGKWLILVAVVGTILAALAAPSPTRGTSTIARHSQTATTSSASEPDPLTESKPSKYDIIRQVTVNKFSWRKGGFGTVMMISGRIVNPTNYDVKDLLIGCAYAANSGTPLGTVSKTLYDSIPARGTKNFSDFSVGFIDSQAASARCLVDDLTIVAERAAPEKAKPSRSRASGSRGL